MFYAMVKLKTYQVLVIGGVDSQGGVFIDARVKGNKIINQLLIVKVIKDETKNNR